MHARRLISVALPAGLKVCCAASLVALSGCAVGPDYVRPQLSLPTSLTESANTAAGSQTFVPQRDLPAQWWSVFQSRPLNDLIDASLAHNPDVEAARAALRGAQESVLAQQGAYYPGVEASFAPTRQKVASPIASPLSSGANYFSLYTAQVSVSYTLDVFGGNRRAVESLQAQSDAQGLQLEAAYLTLTSNVVNSAIQEAALREQIVATRDLIAGQQQLLTMFERQYALGQVSVADVAAQEAALASVEAALPPLEKQLAQQRDLLKALAGRFPGDPLDASFTLAGLTLPQELPLSLPFALVEHRPDVRAAEEQLHAASAQVGVAIANRLPNITLGVSGYGSSATTLSDLFKAGTGFWALAGNVAQPVFDGGTLKHRQGVAQATYDQAAAQYRATVINAFQNVADVLQAIQSDARALQAAARAENAAARSLEIARRQLALGDISAASLIASGQQYQQARLALIQAQAARFQDTAALFQALGGGWWNRDASVAGTSSKP